MQEFPQGLTLRRWFSKTLKVLETFWSCIMRGKGKKEQGVRRNE
jgi:hypothetical protein